VNDWHKGHESDVQAWCQGRTGVPFIDASQIELITTGYQSNRSRQNIASHFTKDMGHQDWRIGAEFFESNLIDHDVSSNVSYSVLLLAGED
jgi:deoxyribodipyrimidine photo-lyase